jgi:DNA polymerase III epsilon subunit-like protein
MSNIVFLDTETGGTDPKQHSLLSLAAIITDTSFNEIRRFESFVRQPAYVVSGEAIRKNKIDVSGDESWPDALSVKQAFVEFLGLPVDILNGVKNVDNRWVIHGKNPNFDVLFLKAFFGEHVYNSLFMYYTRDVTETFVVLVDEGIYQRPKHLTLQDLCIVLGVEHDENALHNAMYDTEMTLKCAQKMQVQINQVRQLVQQVRARRAAVRGPIA